MTTQPLPHLADIDRTELSEEHADVIRSALAPKVSLQIEGYRH